MPKPLIEKLRKLRYQRTGISPFSSHTDFLVWADNVLPLLTFNSSLQHQFRSAVRAAKTNQIMDILTGYHDNINTAIGILNQAITSLEVNSISNTTSNFSPRQFDIRNDWYKKPIGLIGIGVVITVISTLTLYLLKTHTGLPF